VLALAEEAGEFVGAYRRWAGMARRSGPWSEVQAELADVVITAYLTAHVLGIDLDGACQDKAAVISTRGWKDPMSRALTVADQIATDPTPSQRLVTRIPGGLAAPTASRAQGS